MNITTTTGSLIPITYNDSDFIHELFSDADVKRYYGLITQRTLILLFHI